MCAQITKRTLFTLHMSLLQPPQAGCLKAITNHTPQIRVHLKICIHNFTSLMMKSVTLEKFAEV